MAFGLNFIGCHYLCSIIKFNFQYTGVSHNQWFKRSLPLYQGNLLGDRFVSEDPLHGGVRGSIRKPSPLAVIRNRRLNKMRMGPKWVAMPLLKRGGQQAACHALMSCCYTG